MTRSFSELTKDLSPERRERIEQRKEQLREEMTLSELRKAFLLTQDTLATALNVKQAEISKIENRADMLMRTLRNFFQAMGGDLEVRAVFPDRTIEIANFSFLAGKAAKPCGGRRTPRTCRRKHRRGAAGASRRSSCRRACGGGEEGHAGRPRGPV